MATPEQGKKFMRETHTLADERGFPPQRLQFLLRTNAVSFVRIVVEIYLRRPNQELVDRAIHKVQTRHVEGMAMLKGMFGEWVETLTPNPNTFAAALKDYKDTLAFEEVLKEETILLARQGRQSDGKEFPEDSLQALLESYPISLVRLIVEAYVREMDMILVQKTISVIWSGQIRRMTQLKEMFGNWIEKYAGTPETFAAALERYLDVLKAEEGGATQIREKMQGG